MRKRIRSSKQTYVATVIAEGFNDKARLSMYLRLCKKYGLPLVLRAFAEAKAAPQSSIKKSRLALFRYLLNLYAKERKHMSRT
jgi:hypothetical protein